MPRVLRWMLASWLLIVMTWSSPAHAGWPNNPAVNLAIRTGPGYADYLDAVSDGQGGILMAWTDSRSGADRNVYAQRVGLDGVPIWTPNGAPVCINPGDKYQCRIISDGQGGAFIAWADERGDEPAIFAQRLNANGAPVWATNGVPLGTSPYTEAGPRLARDAVGGLLATWGTSHFSAGHPVREAFAQRVTKAGSLRWGSGGVQLAVSAGNETSPNLVSDEHGGAIVCWVDDRLTTSGLRAQRFDSLGSAQWLADGVEVATGASSGGFSAPSVAVAGNGGVIVVWDDDRLGYDEMDIRAQRLKSTGSREWGGSGKVICDASGTQLMSQYPNSVLPDGTGGWLTAWSDFRDASIIGTVYAQRIATNGSSQWTSDGVCVRATPYGEYDPAIAADGTGGALLAWWDERGSYDVYGQRLSTTGLRLWGAEGVAVSTAPGNQWLPVHVASDLSGGALVTWSDERAVAPAFARSRLHGGSGDVYAQRVDPQGALGGSPVAVPSIRTERTALRGIAPNPVRAGNPIQLRLAIDGSDGDPSEDIHISVYDSAGRRLAQGARFRLPPGIHNLSLGQVLGTSVRLARGRYFVAVRARGVLMRESFVVLR